MASNNTVSIEKFINCAICHERFIDPRLLPCRHTYCFRCIKKVASVNNGQFKCPLRDETNIATDQIESLPPNRVVSDTIELFGSTQCSNCHSVTPAVFWCEECINSYCSECSQTIHAARALQNHRPVSIGEKPPEMVSCETHPDEKLKYWCQPCNTLVCRDCLLLQHKDHTYTLMDEIAQKLKAKLGTDLQGIQASLNDKIYQANALITEVDNANESNKRKIAETMASLRQIIDEHEKTVVQQILSIETDQKTQHKDYQARLQKEQRSLDMQNANFAMLLWTKDHTRLLKAKTEFVDYLSKTIEVLRGLHPPSKSDCHLEGLDQLQKLGEKLFSCGRAVEDSIYHNPQLKNLIADNQANATLDLSSQRLTDPDVKILAHVLQESTVS